MNRIIAAMALAGLCLCIVGIAQAAQVHYNLDLTWDLGAPNGVPREMVYINGKFPGPPLIMDEGDDVTVWIKTKGLSIMEYYSNFWIG